MLSYGRAMQGMPWRKQHVSRDAAVQFSGKACYSRYARAVKPVLKDSDAGNACSKAVLNVAVFFLLRACETTRPSSPGLRITTTP